MSPLGLTALTSALVLSVVAQDWGTVGSWEQVPSTTQGPPIGFRKPSAVSGCFVVLGNNTATSNLAVWTFDIIANAWTQWPDIIAPIGDPYMIEMGGNIVVVDELNQNNLAVIDSANARVWQYPTLTAGPSTRFGQRMIAWGSTLYSFSGVEVTSGLNHNDVWAVDLSAVLAGTGAGMWVQVAVDGLGGLPPPRVGYSFTPFGVGMVMYGGVSVDTTPGTLPDVCFTPSTASVCHFHQSVWAFVPGNKGQPTPGSVTGASWIRMSEAGAYGGPVPVGRFDHAAGSMGDQLFIFGGTTAAGTSSEMWAYNLVSQTWQQVAQTNPWPSTNSDIGYGAGIVIGRHMYQYVQGIDMNGLPLPNTGALWRWAPSPSGGATPAAPAPPIHPGAVAGIVIGILLGIANTVLLVVLANNAGVLALPSLGWPSSKPAVGGFYSDMTATSAAYAPPA